MQLREPGLGRVRRPLAAFRVEEALRVADGQRVDERVRRRAVEDRRGRLQVRAAEGVDDGPRALPVAEGLARPGAHGREVVPLLLAVVAAHVDPPGLARGEGEGAQRQDLLLRRLDGVGAVLVLAAGAARRRAGRAGQRRAARDCLREQHVAHE